MLVFQKQKTVPGISVDSRPYHALGLGGSAPLRGPGARLLASRGPRAPVESRGRGRGFQTLNLAKAFRCPRPGARGGCGGSPPPAAGCASLGAAPSAAMALAAAGGRARRPGSPRPRSRWRLAAGARSLAAAAARRRRRPGAPAWVPAPSAAMALDRRRAVSCDYGISGTRGASLRVTGPR